MKIFALSTGLQGGGRRKENGDVLKWLESLEGEASEHQQGFHKFELAASLDLSSSATASMNSSVFR